VNYEVKTAPSFEAAFDMHPTILLIDDDAALLAGLAEMLTIRLEPVHVETCPRSAFAVRMVQQGRYDVILCDVWMPEINGLDLLPRLREAAPNAPILMMSAALSPSVRNRAFADGATGFLSKPFDRDALTMEIKQILENHYLTKRLSVPLLSQHSDLNDASPPALICNRQHKEPYPTKSPYYGRH
jgi:DNA-binding NtrC family response regulator